MTAALTVYCKEFPVALKIWEHSIWRQSLFKINQFKANHDIKLSFIFENLKLDLNIENLSRPFGIREEIISHDYKFF